ncbi:MAG: PKD domain-containing protein, partial [Bacteroidetes bacterium]|nr:PKD domain-containing protein [Bacteroidota bacterium]
PLPVQFSDNSTAGAGTIVSWSWDFGDGDTSALQNPSHTYTAAANFPVTLKIVNSVGCSNTLTNPGYIKIGSGVKAAFTTTSSSGCSTPITVNFSNVSTGPPTLTYKWDFGDGGTSTQQNPVYSYASAGTYNIELIAISSSGCIDTLKQSTQVSVGGTNISSFNAPDSACSGSNITFTNTSTPVPTVSSWDFGDGTTSSQINPTKSYATAGTYTVKLTNTFGTCVVTTSKQITIINQAVSAFSAVNTISCNAPFTVNFIDQSSNAIGWLWSFGDGTTSTQQNPTHTYTNSGQYTVTLTTTGSGGCNNFKQVNNFIQIVKPYLKISNLPAYGCVPYGYTPTFTDSAVSGTITSYLWDFGDGSTSNVANPPAHTYSSSGKYAVKLTITTSTGCSASTVDTVKVGTMKPTPAFTATPTTVCASTPVQFTDQSTGTPDQWLWDFGDGTLSGSQNPSHIYVKAGTFTVKLIVYNNGCSDSLIKNAYITVNPPISKFGYTFACSSATYQYTFTDQSIGADTWDWDFGDGTPHSNLQNP